MDDSLKFKGLAHENKFLVFEFVGEKFRNLVHSILNRTPSVQKKLDLGLHILFFFWGEGGGGGTDGYNRNERVCLRYNGYNRNVVATCEMMQQPVN